MAYPKQVHDKAWDTLVQRREQARTTAAGRRAEIAQKLPELAQLERRMASSAAQITKSVVLAPARADALIAQLAQENLALQQQRTQLLTAAGYPADYLQEKPFCPLCGDSGYIGQTRCTCLEALLRAEAHNWLGNLSTAARRSFADFSLSYYADTPDASQVIPRRRMGEVLAYCRRYAEAFAPGAESLLLLGQTGLGKTHLSLAIAREVIEQGGGVLYASVQKLMDRLESGRFARDQETRDQYGDNMDIVLSCDLLILDDLGTEFSTAFTNAALYNIINSRLSEQKPVIISTNLDLNGIEERYGQRVASRLFCEYRALKFFGQDVRFLKKMQGQ